MKLLDSGMRVFILAQGTGVRWLRDELNSLKVRIPVTDGCLEELVREADAAAWHSYSSAPGEKSYVTHFRERLTQQAAWVHRWTASDERMAPEDESGQAFVRIARKYALPRPWKLSEPVAVESRRMQPSYWKWATGMDNRALPQA